MNLKCFRVKNFRRLKDVHIELQPDISIFVGANNSGKTSATHALQLFLECSKDKFSIYDFSADCWSTLNKIGEDFDLEDSEAKEPDLPAASLDLWFEVNSEDLHRVIDVLPSLEWSGVSVGFRIEFGSDNFRDLLTRFREARNSAAANSTGEFHPWPRTLTDYLTEQLNTEYALRYFVLDRQGFDSNFRELSDYKPSQLLPDKGRGGAQIIKSLLKVDILGAQRHLSDAASGGRSEDLSKCLSRFYNRHLQQREQDYLALRALTDSEASLNDHLESVFEQTLKKLKGLGYPGVKNPRLVIKSSLNPATLMSSPDGARVHYKIDGEGGDAVLTLPDRYNGLGFKNLIYMVVELLDIHTEWLRSEDRPPLHLIFVEEPEAHLHTQLQQVFVRQVLDLIRLDADDLPFYKTQLVITTHSPHILYERGFEPIRYFRRVTNTGYHTSEVLNLSAFYSENDRTDFLVRYLKLSHCDLFFSDAAILVEGNVERLLLPLMISKVAGDLGKNSLSILEVGGAYAYRFKELIEFLGLTTLIITDIDSVHAPAPRLGKTGTETESEEEDIDADAPDTAIGACRVEIPNAVTSNLTLIEWLPGKTTIAELQAATDDDRTQILGGATEAKVRVTYQTQIDVAWKGETATLTGRTLEEAFAIENLPWSQDADRNTLNLRIPRNSEKTLEQLTERIHNRIKSKNFGKTDFALALLDCDPSEWTVPTYIRNGLEWLVEQLAEEEEQPLEDVPATPEDVAARDPESVIA